MPIKPVYEVAKVIQFEPIRIDEGKSSESTLLLRLEILVSLDCEFTYCCSLFRYETLVAQPSFGAVQNTIDETILVKDFGVLGEAYHFKAANLGEAVGLAVAKVNEYFSR